MKLRFLAFHTLYTENSSLNTSQPIVSAFQSLPIVSHRLHQTSKPMFAKSGFRQKALLLLGGFRLRFTVAPAHAEHQLTILSDVAGTLFMVIHRA